ncbi:MAG: sugar ABC transporter substrate-binding protein [Armatimonadota bacterium]|nr:sugar ABC transporter substrate-binding protein [Armatimonadota bacterium]MDR7450753.1 sugar ABC transporter substrate-binding protein [Armatimonadota bacterium]MDR7466109.1 sugar ABC transporter substrate-binding protein [Armatimonadota bacterium]MDR7493854.1 sugar ABC transporter substrate-binding protein [Armatimonadota bacterium]MDR7498985.1 sugar ABC transporter substrate-binding protein [Armatimonadota bacterium]
MATLTIRTAALLALVLAVAAAAPAAPRATIEFWTISLQPFFTDFVQGLVAGYERANPGVQVRWVDVQMQAIEQKLLAAIAGGVPPDVVNLNVEFTVRIAEKGALLDMDGAVPAADRAKYFEGLWTSARYRGRSYGIPWYIAPPVLFYNSDLFKHAGLDPLRPPATEEEMIEAARRIKDRTRTYGFMPLIDGTRLMHRFLENGLPMLSPDGRRAVFNSPAHVAYLAKYVDLFKKDYFPDDTLRRGFAGAVERYSAGQLGMLLVGPQFLLRIKESNPEVYAKTFVGPYPMGGGKVIHTGLMVLAVPKTSRNAAEAVRFALYVTNDENQLAFSKLPLTVLFPSTRKAAADPFFKQQGAGPEWKARAIAADELKFGRDLTVVVANQSELYKIFREAVESAFFGKMSPKEALDWAVREWNARL